MCLNVRIVLPVTVEIVEVVSLVVTEGSPCCIVGGVIRAVVIDDVVGLVSTTSDVSPDACVVDSSLVFLLGVFQLDSSIADVVHIAVFVFWR